MSIIAIIDDNKDQSTTLKRTLNIYLKRQSTNLTVIDQTPFKNVEDYFPFFAANDVSAIILDERLNDVAVDGEPVDYKGNQLVEILRERLKDFPIYMITAHAGDAELREKENQFEMVINRLDITSNQTMAANFVSRLARSAQRYIDANKDELKEFTELSLKAANGEASPENVERLKALQTVLELPISNFDDRKIWLDRYENELKYLEELKNKIQNKLKAK